MLFGSKAYFQGFHISLPTTFAGRQFVRTITEDEFLLSNHVNGDVVMSFPLPMVALKVRGKLVSSYSIKGIQVSLATRQWDKKAEQYRAAIQANEELMPGVFEHQRASLAQLPTAESQLLVVVHKALRSSVHEVMSFSVHEVPRFHTK